MKEEATWKKKFTTWCREALYAETLNVIRSNKTGFNDLILFINSTGRKNSKKYVILVECKAKTGRESKLQTYINEMMAFYVDLIYTAHSFDEAKLLLLNFLRAKNAKYKRSVD